jgi:serine/threonine protein kinase
MVPPDEPHCVAPCHPETSGEPIPDAIGDYELRGVIGEGSFSTVKLAFSRSTRRFLACKVVDRRRLCHQNLLDRFECEIRVHQQLHHPSIVSLVDLMQDEFFNYVFLEFCPSGELFQLILNNNRLTEEQAKPLLRQLLSGVKYLHEMGVAHRDLKPENLLLTQYGHIKISDFGLSKFLDPHGLVATPCGSPCYASPECLTGLPYDGRTNDCWSVGVIFYAMVTGQLPWTKRNQRQLFEQIRRAEYTIPLDLSQPCRNLIRGLLTVSTALRLTADAALRHPFFTGARGNGYGYETGQGIVSLAKVDRFFRADSSALAVVMKPSSSQAPMRFAAIAKAIKKKKP